MISLQLVAVQAEVSLADYASAEAFRRNLFAAIDAITAETLDRALPTVIAFPEAYGTFLLLAGLGDCIRGAKTTDAALRALVLRKPLPLLRQLLHWRTLNVARAFHQSRADAVDAIYVAAFRDAITRLEASGFAKAWIVAGSCLLPDLPSAGSASRSRLVFNQGYVFGPGGTIVHRYRKRHLVPSWETGKGISAGGPESRSELVAPDPVPLSVLVCYDGFFPSRVEQAVQNGARLIVQPSAHQAGWNEPWMGPFDSTSPYPAEGQGVITEGEFWHREGLLKQLSRDDVEVVGLNPMLVGKLLDARFEGRSSIVQGGRPARLLGEARAHDSFAIVAASVQI